MSTILPPGAQSAPPPPSQSAQAAPTAVVREPSVELLRASVGTRLEGTVVSPPQPQPATTTQSQPQTQALQDAARLEAARAAVQTLQRASDSGRIDARSTQNAQNSTQAQPQITIRTPSGDVTLRTPLPIPEGARVAVEIASNTTSQTTVRLTAVNGQPVQQAMAQLAGDRAPTPPPNAPPPAVASTLGQSGSAPLGFGQMWTPGGSVSLTQAGPLNAFVISSNPPGPLGAQPTAAQALSAPPSSAGAQPPLLAGSDLTIRVTGISTGQNATTPSGLAATGQTPTGAAVSASGTSGLANTAASNSSRLAGPITQATPGTTTTQAGPTNPGVSPAKTPMTPPASQTAPSPQSAGALLPSGGGTQSGLRLVSSQGWPAPPFAPPGNVQGTPVRLALTGIVAAQSANAPTVIQTDAGNLQLANRVNLPAGTTVTLDILTQAAPQTGATGASPAAPPVTAANLPFTTGAAPWPALTEALQVLQRSDPQAAQLLANTISDGGPRTVVAALSFIQAMRTGDPRQWPGDNNLRALERAGPRGAHLARAVAGEVAQLSAQSREATGEWRSTPIPWNAEGQIEKISLITRREDPPDDDRQEIDKGKAGLRFLLDLDLTNLGPLQLDGMVREDSGAFDLMIRSHEPLTETIRLELTGLFIAANQAVGLKGQLTFQVSQKFADPIGSSEPLKLERDGVWA